MRRDNSAKSRWRQLGQSMAEYTVVMAALVGGLLVANRGACPSEYEDCIEYLLTVMHDNYDGYSSSISAVHSYDRNYAYSGPGSQPEPPAQPDPPSSPPGVPPEPPAMPPVRDANVVYGPGGSAIGVVDEQGNVSLGGEVIGHYDPMRDEFTGNDGSSIGGVVVLPEVVDEEDSVLQLVALVECGSDAVYGFAYQSEADGNFYQPPNYTQIGGSSCTQPTHSVYLEDGSVDGGRVVNGYYYPSIYGGSFEAVGEVVYFEEQNVCLVMAMDWDAKILDEYDDDEEEEIYEAMVESWENPSEGEMSPKMATMKPEECNENRTISPP